MSKIQDALRKIRENGRLPGQSGSKYDYSDAVPLARIVTNGDSGSASSEEVGNGRELIIDRQALRDAGLLAPEGQERSVADQYRLIKRPLLDNAAGRNAHDADDANLIMISSALAGDGKTFNCINLALSIAQEKDNSVLLVDADIAKPHISRLFNVAEEKGLIDILNDPSLDINDVTIRTDVPGLSMMPAGNSSDHATELLASKRMARLVSALSSQTRDRVVVFDSPPLLETSEAHVLAGLMGQIVLVVCAGRTPQKAVISALESFDKSKAVNLLFNQAATGLGSESYGQYAYGYGYGSESEA